MAASRDWGSIDDLINAFLQGEKAIPSLREHLDAVIAKWRDDISKANKTFEHDSGNFQHYQRLANLLDGKYYRDNPSWLSPICKMAEKRITEITSEDADRFVAILYENGARPRNYFNVFRATIYDYRNNVLKERKGTFRLLLNGDSLDMLKISSRVKKQKKVITYNEYEMLFSLDTSKIPVTFNKAERKQVLLDFLILLYGLSTRPIDLLKCRIEDLKEDAGVLCWQYTATKMKNTKIGTSDSGNWLMQIHPRLQPIIQRYKGERTAGYLLPLLEEGLSWKEIESKRNYLERVLNRFLKAVAEFCNWSVKGSEISLYTLRHSCITNLVAKGVNTVAIATWAHTSIREIENTYVNRNFIATQIEVPL